MDDAKRVHSAQQQHAARTFESASVTSERWSMRRDNESTLDTVAAGANVAEAPADDGVGDTLAGDTTASSMFAVPAVERERERSSPGVSGAGYEVAFPAGVSSISAVALQTTTPPSLSLGCWFYHRSVERL